MKSNKSNQVSRENTLGGVSYVISAQLLEFSYPGLSSPESIGHILKHAYIVLNLDAISKKSFAPKSYF